jgi:hypothetical protein
VLQFRFTYILFRVNKKKKAKVKQLFYEHNGNEEK